MTRTSPTDEACLPSPRERPRTPRNAGAVAKSSTDTSQSGNPSMTLVRTKPGRKLFETPTKTRENVGYARADQEVTPETVPSISGRELSLYPRWRATHATALVERSSRMKADKADRLGNSKSEKSESGNEKPTSLHISTAHSCILVSNRSVGCDATAQCQPSATTREKGRESTAIRSCRAFTQAFLETHNA
jgi:hypothetical protein